MTCKKLAVALVAACAIGAIGAPASGSANPTTVNGDAVGQIVKTYWKSGGMADFRHVTADH